MNKILSLFTVVFNGDYITGNTTFGKRKVLQVFSNLWNFVSNLLLIKEKHL
jgi:hypothetical protein